MRLYPLSIIGSLSIACIGLYLTSTASLNFSNTSLLQGDHTEIESAFIQFIAKYGKSYASKSEVPSRFENFSKIYKMIKAHNSKPDATSTMEIN